MQAAQEKATATLSKCGKLLRAFVYRGQLGDDWCSRWGRSPLDGNNDKGLDNPQPSLSKKEEEEGSQTVREGISFKQMRRSKSQSVPA